MWEAVIRYATLMSWPDGGVRSQGAIHKASGMCFERLTMSLPLQMAELDSGRHVLAKSRRLPAALVATHIPRSPMDFLWLSSKYVPPIVRDRNTK